MSSDIPNTESIDRVLSLAPAKVLTVNGFDYIDKDKNVTLAIPNLASGLRVWTLTGFIDLLEAGFENFDTKDVLVHVESHSSVKLVADASNKWAQRQVFVWAELLKPEREFQFNTFIPQEQFVIQLRSLFIQDSQLDDLVRLAGNLAQNTEIRQEDDGFTQRATVKSGVVMVNERTVLPRVTLAPFRTFREVPQPASEYVFRVKHDERSGNTCALFEADGGMWKLSAIQNIKTYLANQLKGSEVEGLADIPVIA